jgi:SAM-dependent methyltransferase
MSEPAYYARLDFNAPMSGARADALAASLAARRPRRVVDIGCGWAEFLLRVAAAAADAKALGVDSDDKLIERGRANARERGLSERVELRAADGTEPLEPADLVICVGSDHVFGDQCAALRALYPLVVPGGVLFFGSGFWQRPPSPEEAAGLGAVPEDLGSLADLVDRCTDAGFRPLDIATASEDEWNAFESGFLSDREEWLVTNPSAPAAPDWREQADAHRTGWLRGYRGVLGWAILTLGRPSSP